MGTIYTAAGDEVGRVALYDASGAAVAAAGTKGTPAVTTAAPTTTAASILPANASRKSATIINNGTQTVYLGTSAGVTSATGIPLAAGGGGYQDSDTTAQWFAIAASGTGDLRIVEVA